MLKKINTERRKRNIVECEVLVASLRGYIHAFADMGFIHRSTELRLCSQLFSTMSRKRAKVAFMYYVKQDLNFPVYGCDLDVLLTVASCYEKLF